MPDTGAPWNIPYVAGTDLVRDWPTDSQELAEAIADGLDAAGNEGIGSNVVQTVKTDVFTTSSTSFTDVTGLTVTITPSSATAKVLVIAQVSTDSAANEPARVNLLRGSTAIAQPTGAGTSPATVAQSNLDNVTTTHTIVFLDSPASASAVTYKIQVATAGGSMKINQLTRNVNFETVSTLTAIEVAV